MPLTRSLSLAGAAALVAGLAHAGDPVKMEKADLEKALSGKSMSYLNVNGSAAMVNFEKDGRATYKTGNSKASIGTWQVGDDGRYCIKIISGNTPDHCRRVWKTDTGYAINGGTDNLVPVNLE